jgi:hypothetical protein
MPHQSRTPTPNLLLHYTQPITEMSAIPTEIIELSIEESNMMWILCVGTGVRNEFSEEVKNVYRRMENAFTSLLSACYMDYIGLHCEQRIPDLDNWHPFIEAVCDCIQELPENLRENANRCFNTWQDAHQTYRSWLKSSALTREQISTMWKEAPAYYY